MVNMQQLWGQLSPTSQGAVGPVLQRWDGFSAKIRERLGQIQAEAGPGIDQVVAVDPMNTNAISAALTAVESRTRGLSDKVQEAEEKLSETLDEATDDLDVEGPEQLALARIESGLVEQSRQLQRDIEWQTELLVIAKRADWARVLQQKAKAEPAPGAECSNCGGPLTTDITWQATNVTCGHCGTVGSVQPGMVTSYYYQGVYDLAREQSREAWLNFKQAEHWYNELRLPTEEDFQRFLGAAANYWNTYHQHCQNMHPGFGQTIEEATAAKMVHYTAHEVEMTRTERRNNSQVVQLLTARDRNGLMAFVQQSGFDAEEAARAGFERGDFEGAAMAFSVVHQLEGEDEPLQEYISEQMASLAR